jgi:hypothetical protein
MPTHDPDRPWRDLEARITRQLELGIARPLPVSEIELFHRNLHARAAARRAQTGTAP